MKIKNGIFLISLLELLLLCHCKEKERVEAPPKINTPKIEKVSNNWFNHNGQSSYVNYYLVLVDTFSIDAIKKSVQYECESEIKYNEEKSYILNFFDDKKVVQRASRDLNEALSGKKEITNESELSLANAFAQNSVGACFHAPNEPQKIEYYGKYSK